MTGSTRGEGTGAPAGHLRPTRRTVLGLTYAAALAGAGACGLRLDLPEPPPPIPTRRPVPDEELLVGLVRELEGLASQAGAVTRLGGAARTVATLGELFAKQAGVVTGRLTNDGVPTEVIRPPSATPSGASTGATTAPGQTTSSGPTAAPAPVSLTAFTEQLADVETANWRATAAATPPNRDLVLSIRSVRLSGADLLGSAPTFDAKSAPVRPLLVERTAPLVYGFEVVAAQSAASARTRALTALEEAADLLSALGGTSTTAPGGWALPFPVTTQKEATRLAQHLLGTAIAATTTVADTAPDARSLEETGRWSARVQAMGARWGLPLTAFPGMDA